ncbi:SPASM domain-containing protein [Thermococcus sp.]
MQRVEYVPAAVHVQVGSKGVITGKPPWSLKPHSGKLERMILQLGSGRGRFSEVTGIPRSIGCIGNNEYILRREPLSIGDFKRIILDFEKLGGKELWITNYDRVEVLLTLANFAVDVGIPEVYAVVLFEDLASIRPIEGVKFVVEISYPEVRSYHLEGFEWIHGVLAMVHPDYLDDLMNEPFPGEVYADVLFPGSAKRMTINTIELRRILNPTTEKYHDCLAGMIAVTAEGYVLPCPILRNYVVGDVKKEGLKKIVRRKRLRTFWRMTKDKIPSCSSCPFRYICHDCRALEYQATGEIDGVEYCPIFLSSLQNSRIDL